MKNFKISIQFLAALGTLTLFGCQEEFNAENFEEMNENSRRLIAKTESDIEEIEEALEELSAHSENAVASSEAYQMLEDEVKASSELIDQLEPKVKANMALLQAYQARFQVKNSFTPGEKMGDFVLKSGLAIKGGTVTKLRGGEVGISHSTGIGYFSVDDLPEQFQERILAGPPKPAAPVNVAAILGSKPMSKEAAKKSTSSKRQNSLEEKLAERQVQRAAELKEEAAARELRIKAGQDVKTVMAQIAVVNKSLYAAKRTRLVKIRELASQAIKTSNSDKERQLAPYEQNIEKLENQKKGLEQLKRELLNKMR